MIRFLYFSTAIPTVTQQTVADIVARATIFNAETGITGALAYNGYNFCQVLEGADAQVHALAEKIKADPRHSGFKVLGEKPITERQFANWSMLQVDRLDFSIVINSMND